MEMKVSMSIAYTCNWLLLWQKYVSEVSSPNAPEIPNLLPKQDEAEEICPRVIDETLS